MYHHDLKNITPIEIEFKLIFKQKFYITNHPMKRGVCRYDNISN